jgi:hypothetical protein
LGIFQKEGKVNSYKTTARVVGALFIIATIAYTIGNALLTSILSVPDYLSNVYSNSALVVSGVLLEFVAAAANVFIGVLIFPVLKRYSERGALGYLATRIFDGAGLVIAATAMLWLVTLSGETLSAGTESAAYSLILGKLLVAGSEMTFHVTMFALGLGGIFFSYLLFQSRLIPRAMAILGIISYVSLLIGSALELFGFSLNMLHFVPGGIFELIMPLWLFAKGFNLADGSSEAAKSGINEKQMSLSAT